MISKRDLFISLIIIVLYYAFGATVSREKTGAHRPVYLLVHWAVVQLAYCNIIVITY